MDIIIKAFNERLKAVVKCMKPKGTKVVLYLNPVTQHYISNKMVKAKEFNLISRQYIKEWNKVSKT